MRTREKKTALAAVLLINGGGGRKWRVAVVTTQDNVIATENAVVATPGEPVITPDSNINLEEKIGKAFVFDPGVRLTDIVDAINAIGATPSDLVAILEALKVSGALRAQLIII